jgi:hypothetical protein
MKSILNGLMVSCLLIAVAGTAAFAKTKRSQILLASDTKVNGTLVKKGMYQVVFDDETGELSLLKGAKLIVKTAARLEPRDQKTRGVEVQTTSDGMDQKLVSVAFGGSEQKVVVTMAPMQAGSN